MASVIHTPEVFPEEPWAVVTTYRDANHVQVVLARFKSKDEAEEYVKYYHTRWGY